MPHQLDEHVYAYSSSQPWRLEREELGGFFGDRRLSPLYVKSFGFLRDVTTVCPARRKISGGHRLPAKVLIPTVGSRWRGGDQGEPEALSSLNHAIAVDIAP